MKFVTLLCCINHSGYSDHISELTFYAAIQPLAPIINLKLINTYGQARAFIQVENDIIATRLIQELNGKSLNVGKIKIFHSHKKYVVFDKPLKQVLAEAAERPKIKNPYPWEDNITNNINQNKRSLLSYKDSSFNDDEQADQINYSKEFDMKTVFNISHHHSDFKNNINIHNKLKSDNILKKLISGESDPTKSSTNKSNTLKKSLIQSRIVRIDSICVEMISCQMIFNLFGCFGNILKIWLIQQAKIAFIEYEHHKHARRVVQSTNMTQFFDHEIRVNLSNESQTISYIKQFPINDVKYIKGNFKFFRFKDDMNKPIKQLQKTLHFTHISPNLTAESLCEVISQLHQPIRLVQGQFKGSDEQSYLVEFANLSESMKVIALLHNRKVEGRKFKVEFIDINDCSWMKSYV